MGLISFLAQRAQAWVKTQADHLLFRKPKLYFFVKILFTIAMLAQRTVLSFQVEMDDWITYKICGQVLILILLGLEIVMFRLFTKRPSLKNFTDLFFAIFQVILSECLIAVSVPLSDALGDKLNLIVQQEVIFICLGSILFTQSLAIRLLLSAYITSTFFFRLSETLELVQSISWIVMVVTILLSAFYVFMFSEDVRVERYKKEPSKAFEKLETIPHGLAILTKDQKVIYMNGVFKGILDLADEKDALQEILSLKKFESYSPATQQQILKHVKMRSDPETPGKSPVAHSKSGEQKFGRFNSLMNKKIVKSKSLVPKAMAPAILIKKASKMQSEQDTLQDNQEPLTRVDSPDSLMNKRLLSQQTSKLHINLSDHGLLGSSPKQISILQSEDGSDSQNTVGHSLHSLLTGSEDLPKKMRRKETWSQVAKNITEKLTNRRTSSPDQIRRSDTYLNLSNNKTQKMRAVHQNYKGEIRILEITLTPIITDNKEAIFVYLSDVSSEMKVKDLKKHSQFQDQMLRFVSHEFRTPLNISIISLNMLKPLLPDELITNYLSPALNSSKMLLSLVNDILDYAQMKERKLSIAIAPCILKNVLKEIVGMMETQALSKNIKIKLEWDPNVTPVFHTDEKRLKQILLNLISNALKFTLKGSVTLRVDNIETKVCKISVIDTGVGISQENLKNLFQEFGKIKGNDDLNPHGIGLGLVISRLLSLELGPDKTGIQVSSEVGVGTTFYFLLSSQGENQKSDEIGENTELNSSDEEDPGLHEMMPRINEQEGMLPFYKKLPTSSDQMWLEKTNRRRKKSKGVSFPAAPYSRSVKKTVTDPIFSHFQNFYSKSSFSRYPSYIPTVASVPDRDLYSHQLYRRMKYHPRPIPRVRRCVTEYDLEESTNHYSVQVAKIVNKLKRKCGCPKILLVDDSAFNLLAFKMMLQSFGIETIGVNDGEAAVEEVKNNEGHSADCRNFSLIFMDIEMPGMDGFEASYMLREMMRKKEISYIPIIGVSGRNPQDQRVDCLLSGMNDMVEKPVSPGSIQELICKWIVL